MGGSSKRQLADGSWIRPNTIGKLRRLRLPLPPLVFHLERAGEARPTMLLAQRGKCRGFGGRAPVSQSTDSCAGNYRWEGCARHTAHPTTPAALIWWAGLGHPAKESYNSRAGRRPSRQGYSPFWSGRRTTTAAKSRRSGCGFSLCRARLHPGLRASPGRGRGS
jgi:hypothetical protein